MYLFSVTMILSWATCTNIKSVQLPSIKLETHTFSNF